jgi:hypothetical protein
MDSDAAVMFAIVRKEGSSFLRSRKRGFVDNRPDVCPI